MNVLLKKLESKEWRDEYRYKIEKNIRIDKVTYKETSNWKKI